MFSLIRSGPKALLIESNNTDSLKKYLTLQLGAAEYDYSTAFEKAGEAFTILFLTKHITDTVSEKDIIDTLIIEQEPDVFLCQLINDGQTALLTKLRTAPRIIIVRSMGDLESVVQEIKADHGGSTGSLMEILNSRNEKGTLVAVTDKPLHRSFRIGELYEKCLYIDERFYPLFKSLRLHALKYLNRGIGNKDWYELEIRIYDRYSAYKLHYERLSNLFDFLELGIILGESWTKDYPRLMMSVGVYRLRFFTLHDPKYLKKILLGLEYLEDNTRIVDFDLYYQRKKMDWTDAIQPGDPRVRHELGLKYRKEIFSRLTEHEAEKIMLLEEAVLRTRY
ncbi:MAG: hypothetical protein ACOZCL_02710 [Bacillota bacterium]